MSDSLKNYLEATSKRIQRATVRAQSSDFSRYDPDEKIKPKRKNSSQNKFSTTKKKPAVEYISDEEDLFALIKTEKDVEQPAAPSSSSSSSSVVDNDVLINQLEQKNDEFETIKAQLTVPEPESLEEVVAQSAPISFPIPSSSSGPDKAIKLHTSLGMTTHFPTFLNSLMETQQRNTEKVNRAYPNMKAGVFAPRTSSTKKVNSSLSMFNLDDDSDLMPGDDDSGITAETWAPYFPMRRVMEFMSLHEGDLNARIPAQQRQACTVQNDPERISSKHVALMLTEAYGPFKPCVWGLNCVAYQQFSKFKCMEYLSPEQYEQVLKSNSSSSYENSMCIICWMCSVLIKYLINQNKGGMCSQIQVPFYFKVGEPGEYCQDAMILPITKFTSTLLGQPLTTRCGSENTYGLVVPFRSFATEQFCMDVKSVTLGDGTVKTVRCLREADWLFFTVHSTHVSDIRRVDPLKYAKPVITELPTTDKILTDYFNFKNTEHVIGIIRLLSYGDASKIPEGKVPLFQYWCMAQKNGYVTYGFNQYEFEPFMWELVFCKNIGRLLNHLPQFLRSGRIDVSLLHTHYDLSECTVDLSKPLTYYEYQLRDDPRFQGRLLYLTLCLRIIILRTLIRVYTNSKNSERDGIVHRHMYNFLKWHLDVHAKQITCDYEDDPSASKILKELNDSEIPLHMYASNNTKFLKYRTEIRSKELPSTWLCKYYPRLAWCFGEFKDMVLLEKLEYDFADCRHLIVPPSLRSVFIPQAPHLMQEYSILACLLVRVNLSLNLHEELLTGVLALRDNYRRINMNPKEHTPEELLDARIALKEARELRYQLRLFAYTHINLAVRMYELGLYRDEDMTNRHMDRGNRNHMVCHYTEVYPYASATVHEGNLPNLSSIIIGIPFLDRHDDTRTSTKPPNEAFKMWGKLLPHSYHARCQLAKHLALCEKQQSYLYFTLNVLEVMLLGAYRHSDHIPPFMRALTIYKFFNTHLNISAFMQWQSSRGAIVILALREFLCWTIERTVPYETYIINNFPYWVKFKRRVMECSDIVRMEYAHLDNLEPLQYLIQMIFKSPSSTAIHDPMSEPFIQQYFGTEYSIAPIIKEQFVNIVPNEPIVKRLYVDPVRAVCRHLMILNQSRSRSGYKRPDKLPKYVFRCLYAKVKSLEPHTPVDALWFREFNFVEDLPLIQDTTITLLEYVFYFIMQGSTANEYVEQALRAIPPLEYEIIDAFFHLLLTHYSIRVFYLPTFELERQIDALKRRFCIDPDDDLTHTHSPYTFCLLYGDCCATLRSYTAQLNGAHAYGAKLVGIDSCNGQAVCKAPTTKGMERKMLRVKHMLWRRLCDATFAADRVALQRAFKRMARVPTKKGQLRFNAQPECGSIPLSCIYMPGVVVQITDTHISVNNDRPVTNAMALCTVCGSLSDFSTRMYDANGFECTACEFKQVKERYTPTCVPCKQKIKTGPNSVLHDFMVFNDRPNGDMRINREYVCNRCYKCKTANWHPDHIFTVTDLEKNKHEREEGMEWIRSIRNGEELGDGKFTVGVNNRKRLIRSRKK